MKQTMYPGGGRTPYGNYHPVHQKKNGSNIALWICIGLLVMVLLVGMMFVGLFMLRYARPKVPDVSGLSLSEATTRLEDAGYVCSKEFVFDEAIPADHVISQSPAAGMLLKRGSMVDLTVATDEVEKTPELSGTDSVKKNGSNASATRVKPAEPAITYPAEGTQFVNAFSNSGIYVRSAATTAGSKKLYIKAGDTTTRLTYLRALNMFDENDWKWYTWYRVELPDGTLGYVRSDVVKIAGTVHEVEQTWVGDYLVNTFSNSGIYVRSSASTSSSQVAYIAAGDTNYKMEFVSSVEASDGTWYYVKLPNGMYGYVRSDVVRWW